LGSRKGGFDDLRGTLQQAFAALILNRDFNFTEMVYTHMWEHVKLKVEDRFIMYPRFVQMIINHQHSDLPKELADIMELKHMNDNTLRRVLSYRGKTANERPPVKRLFGHLADPEYKAPIGKKWHHEDSDSDVENIQEVSGSESSDEEEAGNVGAGTSSKTGETEVNPSAKTTQGLQERYPDMNTLFIDLQDVLDEGDQDTGLIPERERRSKEMADMASMGDVLGEGLERTAVDELLDAAAEAERKRKGKRIKTKAKRQRLVYTPSKPTSTSSPSATATPTGQTTQQTSTPVQPMPQSLQSPTVQTVGPSTASLQEQISQLSQIVIKLVNQNDERKTENERLLKTNQDLERQLVVLREEHIAQNLMIDEVQFNLFCAL